MTGFGEEAITILASSFWTACSGNIIAEASLTLGVEQETTR
jgi:hypothetical protein